MIDLGTMDYLECWNLQKELVAKRAKEEISDQLIFVEHPHVVTLGRRNAVYHASSHDSDNKVPVYEIERGGEATYHGPGQLVAYPILKLSEGRRDLHRYLRSIEEVLIRTLNDFSIESHQKDGATGVWLKDRQKKIASIGIGVKRWVTYHGLALNVSTDLSYFGLISPCGFDSSVMTSMENELAEHTPMHLVKDRVIANFQSIFETEIQVLPSISFQS